MKVGTHTWYELSKQRLDDVKVFGVENVVEIVETNQEQEGSKFQPRLEQM